MEPLPLTMNLNNIFVLSLGLALCALFLWGFRGLPKENWQILACIPLHKNKGEAWQGINYTWYGFFQATGYILGVSLFLILMGAVAVPGAAALILIVLILAVCAPLSRILAGLVEGKRFTLTVGGAVFAGLVISPLLIGAVNEFGGDVFGFHLPMLPALTAMAIGHIMGEGTGRLACISFGCCYGKPLSLLPPLVRKALGPFAMTFYGTTKKISYAHGLEGQPVVPVQALTAVIYTLAGLTGMWFFLAELYLPAFAVTVGTAQGWRFLSEFLRADYRGRGRISPYQFMSLLALPYAGGLLFFFPSVPPPGGTQLMAGLATLWTPGIILFLQVLWFLIFLYTGRSRVTAAEISLHVIKDRV
jgi:hypothetical protein